MSTTVSIEGVGTLKQVTVPFNEALRILREMGAKEVVSFADLARSRKQAGYGHLLFKADSLSTVEGGLDGTMVTWAARWGSFHEKNFHYGCKPGPWSCAG